MALVMRLATSEQLTLPSQKNPRRKIASKDARGQRSSRVLGRETSKNSVGRARLSRCEGKRRNVEWVRRAAPAADRVVKRPPPGPGDLDGRGHVGRQPS